MEGEGLSQHCHRGAPEEAWARLPAAAWHGAPGPAPPAPMAPSPAASAEGKLGLRAAGGWQRRVAAEAQDAPDTWAPVSETGSVPLQDLSSLLPFLGLGFPICKMRGCLHPCGACRFLLGSAPTCSRPAVDICGAKESRLSPPLGSAVWDGPLSTP